MLFENFKNLNLKMKDRKYINFITSLASSVKRDSDDFTPIVPHHTGLIFIYFARGKVDYTAVPLTLKQHTELHTIGQSSFELKYNIDLKEIVIKLLTLYIKRNI